ncbi:hypothetical protein KOR42_23490 [Thalassoglobus neptunius]|uniref:Uncharacterized protein n=1 Tax=Thalassoglobus neptunius TaxID=1938619 RepID=A0A5C5XAQ8_9PLAN|nr:hypothetical protein [Thalassoglobus neptunius]TWT58962.1 hypothetical protein KOR42_23490 [Thalassoglobus neptunius]
MARTARAQYASGEYRHYKGSRWVAHVVKTADYCRLDGKLKLSKKAAKRQKRHMESLGDNRLNTYRCPHCGSWHVGHNGRIED